MMGQQSRPTAVPSQGATVVSNGSLGNIVTVTTTSGQASSQHYQQQQQQQQIVQQHVIHSSKAGKEEWSKCGVKVTQYKF